MDISMSCFTAACQSRASVNRLVVQHSYGDSTLAINKWVEGIQLQVEPHILAQCADNDLGVKIMSALEYQLGQPGTKKVLVVGSDIPDLSADILQAASAALDTYEVVLGPAVDGGYYLLGLTRGIPELFQDIPWSTPAVLQCTLAAAAAANARVAPVDTLPTLRDIDTLTDLKQWFDHAASHHYHGDENGASAAANTNDAEGHQTAASGSEAHELNACTPLQTARVPDTKCCLLAYVEDLLKSHMPC